MRQAACASARALVVLAAASAVGCLPDSHPVEGRQLYQGRDVENLRFVTVRSRSYVSFEVRKQRRAPAVGGVLDWRLAGFDDGSPLVVISDRSDAWAVQTQDLDPTYPPSDDPREREYLSGLEVSDRLYYAMRDERPPDPAAGVPRTGTLVIATLAGVREQIPYVESFTLGPKPGVFYYRRPAPGRPASDLVLRDDQGRERVLQDVTGPASFYGETGLMFLGGAERTLYRMRSIDAPLEPLRAGVSRYSWVDGNRAILTVADQGRPVATLFTVSNRRERRLPGDSICCWLPPRGGRVWYAEAATKDAPARLHFYDVDSGDDAVLPLPRELVDVSGVIPRPRTDTVLLVDSAAKLAALDLGAKPPTIAPLALNALNPTFTKDGSRLVYVTPDPTAPTSDGPQDILGKSGIASDEGQLMSSDLVNPPVALSPSGALVQHDSFFEIDDDETSRIVFWGRFGRTVSDLYFVPPEGGTPKVVANQIRDVSVGLHGLLGIINASLQDLTGDLIRKNLDTGEQRLFSSAVESYSILGNQLAFYVWNRVPAAPDGIWAVTTTSP
jgi:hypothetical protein